MKIIVDLLGNSGGKTISLTLTDILTAIGELGKINGVNVTEILKTITESSTKVIEVVNEGDTEILEAIKKVTGDVTTTNTTINEIDIDVKKVIQYIGSPIIDGHHRTIFELLELLFRKIGVRNYSIGELIGHPDHCHGSFQSIFSGINEILKEIRRLHPHVPSHGGGTSHGSHVCVPTVVDLSGLEKPIIEILGETRDIHAHVVREDGALSVMVKQMTRSLSVVEEIHGSVQRLEHGMNYLLAPKKDCDKDHEHHGTSPVHTPVILDGLEAGKLDSLTRQTAATHHEMTEMGKGLAKLTGGITQLAEVVKTHRSVQPDLERLETRVGTFTKPTYTVAKTLEFHSRELTAIKDGFGKVATADHLSPFFEGLKAISAQNTELLKENAQLKEKILASHDRMGHLERQIALHDAKLDCLIALLSRGVSDTHHGTEHAHCGDKH